MADMARVPLLGGLDPADLPADIRRHLGMLSVRAAGAPVGASLWVPPRYVPGTPAPEEYAAVSSFPQTVYRAPRAVLGKNTGLLGGWTAPANGTVSIQLVPQSSAVLQYSLDRGTNWPTLNDGVALASGAAAGPFHVSVSAGDTIDFSASASMPAIFVRVLYVADIGLGGGGGSAGDLVAARSAVAITPSDTATFAATRGLYVGAAGNAAVTMADGTKATYTGLLAGMTYSLSVVAVASTNTTASSLLGLY